mmetsp:Transcript_20573/g.30651  ORF Transcript_20573/g.30651 Transcript_20573/m.30651 type:complete len:238 (+) Transcript_20573:280-993(+)
MGNVPHPEGVFAPMKGSPSRFRGLRGFLASFVQACFGSLELLLPECKALDINGSALRNDFWNSICSEGGHLVPEFKAATMVVQLVAKAHLGPQLRFKFMTDLAVGSKCLILDEGHVFERLQLCFEILNFLLGGGYSLGQQLAARRSIIERSLLLDLDLHLQILVFLQGALNHLAAVSALRFSVEDQGIDFLLEPLQLDWCRGVGVFGGQLFELLSLAPSFLRCFLGPANLFEKRFTI